MSELGAKDTQGGGVHTWIHVRATPFPMGLPLRRRGGRPGPRQPTMGATAHGPDDKATRRGAWHITKVLKDSTMIPSLESFVESIRL